MKKESKEQENKRKELREKAINIKQNQSDGIEKTQKEISKQEKHQPRDNA